MLFAQQIESRGGTRHLRQESSGFQTETLPTHVKGGVGDSRGLVQNVLTEMSVGALPSERRTSAEQGCSVGSLPLGRIGSGWDSRRRVYCATWRAPLEPDVWSGLQAALCPLARDEQSWGCCEWAPRIAETNNNLKHGMVQS
jgi:hypothetical protein